MNSSHLPLVSCSCSGRSRLHTSIQLVEEGARGENAGYHTTVTTANGVQVRQVRIARDDEIRLTQVGDAGDVVVVWVCGRALDHIPGQLLGDLRRMVMEPQHIVPNLLERDVAAEF